MLVLANQLVTTAIMRLALLVLVVAPAHFIGEFFVEETNLSQTPLANNGLSGI